MRKKVLLIIITLLIPLFGGAVIFGAGANNHKNIEVAASVKENSSTILLSLGTTGWLNDNPLISIQFSTSDDFSSSAKYEMRKIYSYAGANGVGGLMKVRVSSEAYTNATKVRFARRDRNNPSAVDWNSAVTDFGPSLHFFALTNWNAVKSSTNNNEEGFLEPSADTRRIWFRKASTQTMWFNDYCLPCIWSSDSQHRYFVEEHYNNADGKTYYWADVPSYTTTIRIQRVDPVSFVSYNQTNKKTYTNHDLHRILFLVDENIEASVTTAEHQDQYMINAVLTGFVTCSGSDVNGYGAMNDLNEYTITRFQSHEFGTLDSVYQDDYSYGDYDINTNSYLSNREKSSAGRVSCQAKIDMMQNMYTLNAITNSSYHLSIDNNTSVIWVTVSVSGVSLFALAMYSAIRKNKHKKND